MQMFADIDDDERDDNDDDNHDDEDDVASPSTTSANDGNNKGGDTAPVDNTAASKSEAHEENTAHVEDKVDDDEYEVELIPMKEEDDNEQQPTVNRSNDDAATDTVEELPGGLSTDQLTEHIGKLLALLVDEQTLTGLGWPTASCEHVLSGVIEQCGLRPADTVTCPDYVSVMRENAKMLFTSVISNDSIRSLLNNHTVDEVIMHVLKMAN